MIKYIDLTHNLNADAPSWDNGCGFHLKTTLDYSDCQKPNLFKVQKFESRNNMGTHIDAPAHCIPGAKTIDKITLDRLIVNCVVINVSNIANQDYVIPPSIIVDFEKMNGEIESGSFVIFYTGWDKFWNQPDKFRNNLSFPSIHIDTAKILLERNISGLGIDTLSPDAKGEDFPVHRLILSADKYIVENIANAKSMPATGAKILIMPMKIENATEAPIRLLGIID